MPKQLNPHKKKSTYFSLQLWIAGKKRKFTLSSNKPKPVRHITDDSGFVGLKN